MRCRSECLSEKLDQVVLNKLKLPINGEPELLELARVSDTLQKPRHHAKIGLVGKYVELPDAYKSIAESLCTVAQKTNACGIMLYTF
jgi:CTP synthase